MLIKTEEYVKMIIVKKKTLQENAKNEKNMIFILIYSEKSSIMITLKFVE